MTLHIDNLKGENAHHQCETVFKAFARALRMAITPDPRSAGVIPSTKGSALSPMASTVAVVDYGMGNLRSRVAGGDARGARDADVRRDRHRQRPEEVLAADRVVLPGQGAMRDCMRELRESGLQGSRAARRRPQTAAGCVRRHADAAGRTARNRTRRAWA